MTFRKREWHIIYIHIRYIFIKLDVSWYCLLTIFGWQLQNQLSKAHLRSPGDQQRQERHETSSSEYGRIGTADGWPRSWLGEAWTLAKNKGCNILLCEKFREHEGKSVSTFESHPCSLKHSFVSILFGIDFDKYFAGGLKPPSRAVNFVDVGWFFDGPDCQLSCQSREPPTTHQTLPDETPEDRTWCSRRVARQNQPGTFGQKLQCFFWLMLSINRMLNWNSMIHKNGWTGWQLWGSEPLVLFLPWGARLRADRDPKEDSTGYEKIE